MKILIIKWQNHQWAEQKMAGILTFHKNRGDQITFSHFHDTSVCRKIENCDFAYLYNGEYDIAHPIKNHLRNLKVLHAMMEIAWFPQSEHWYFDPQGTNGNSSLHTDPLDWVTQEHYDKLHTKRIEYREGRTLSDEGYILVPLQLVNDTASQWSPFKYTGEIIHHIRKCYPERRIIFRRHPKDPKRYEDLNLGTAGEGDFKELICAASIVIGINSTVLLESALMGKKTIALGKSFLEIGNSQDEALAALIARQVPMTCTDLTPWTQPGLGLETLNV
jgi:hypothetical protein